jgi:hypothetical protein
LGGEAHLAEHDSHCSIAEEASAQRRDTTEPFVTVEGCFENCTEIAGDETRLGHRETAKAWVVPLVELTGGACAPATGLLGVLPQREKRLSDLDELAAQCELDYENTVGTEEELM